MTADRLSSAWRRKRRSAPAPSGGARNHAMASANMHVDLDTHGRGPLLPQRDIDDNNNNNNNGNDDTEYHDTPQGTGGALDLDAQNKTEALRTLGEISRRRSMVRDGDFIAYDACGRGDPRAFAEIRKRLSVVSGRELRNVDLAALASGVADGHAHGGRAADGGGVRRTASHQGRRVMRGGVYSGVVKFFKFHRSSYRAEHQPQAS